MKILTFALLFASLAFGQRGVMPQLRHVKLFKEAVPMRARQALFVKTPTLEWDTKGFDKPAVDLPSGFMKFRLAKVPSGRFIHPLDPRADYKKFMDKPRGGLRLAAIGPLNFVFLGGHMSSRQISVRFGATW